MANGPAADTKIVDAEFIHDLFQPFGAVSVRRMFGGAALFADGVMFGLVSGGQIYLKVDATTVTGFEREQCEPFEYLTKNGKRALTSYWRLPGRLYDDADELVQWARQALAAARRGATVKVKAGRKRMRTKR
jgi:DNA transformation protein